MRWTKTDFLSCNRLLTRLIALFRLLHLLVSQMNPHGGLEGERWHGDVTQHLPDRNAVSCPFDSTGLCAQISSRHHVIHMGCLKQRSTSSTALQKCLKAEKPFQPTGPWSCISGKVSYNSRLYSGLRLNTVETGECKEGEKEG